VVATAAALAAQEVPAAAAARADGRLPIVIGVTGHRHLRDADLPMLRERVRELFETLRRRYPSTPLRIVTALAAGADRLVAEVALDAGHELLVPLPLEPKEYERDFPESAGEFYALIARLPPSQVFVLPGEHGAGHEGAVPHPHRERRYREVGLFIAEQSHLLLALWDGQPSDSSAGTAAVVRFKLEGTAGKLEAGLRALDADDSGPVVHVHTPRAGDTEGAAGRLEWLFPQEGEEALFDTVSRRIDQFNSEPLRRTLAPQLSAAAAALLADIDARPAAERSLAMAFATADLLARHYQRLTKVVLRFTLVFAALLAVVFELYAEVLPWRGLPAGYLAIFASLTAMLLWQRRRDVQGRYLDYRALAEGLRVQFYWRIAGLPDSASGSYLRKQLDELRWIREALRGAAALPHPEQSQPEIALEHWVGGQAAYYANRAHSQRQRLHAFERGSQLFMIGGLASAAALVAFWSRGGATLSRWHAWLVVLMGFAPIGAALWETYAERLGLRTQVNQYARFAGIFRRAGRFAQQLERIREPKERRHALAALLRELGHEALMENGDWVLLLRERPLVLPKG
jgi:hypothetical protein